MQRLTEAGCEKFFREKVSGVSKSRPEFQRMIDQLRPGDVVVVWKLDRVARSTRELLNTRPDEKTITRRKGPCPDEGD
jgi:DNA invertase Pin-like site-specific DNA recombinase